MFEKIKSDRNFVGKTKLAINLYVEHLNHLSWNKLLINCRPQLISKVTKENDSFKT